MKKIITLFLILALSTSLFAQTKVGDVELPNELTYTAATLKLSGYGIREKLWFDIYSAGLYMKSKSSNAESIMKADDDMGLRLHITSKLLSRSKLINAFEEGFVKSTKNTIAPYRKRMDQFLSYMTEVNVGDIYDLVYEKGAGTHVYYKGKKLGVVEGHDFKQALFGIWLCDQPADSKLKNGLLGK